MQDLKQNYKSLFRNIFINDWIVLIPQEKLKDLDSYKSHILTISDLRNEFLNLNSEKVYFRNDQVYYKDQSSHIIRDEIIQSSFGKTLVIYIQESLTGGEIDWNLEKILKEIGQLDTILGKLLKLVSGFNDSAIELNNLSILQAQVVKLIQLALDVLRELDEAEIYKQLSKQRLEWDDFYQIVETWVIEHVYEILFYKISSFHKGLDQEFSKSIQEMQYLDFITLGLPFIDIKNAVQQLESLTIQRTPVEKLNCLVKTLKLISTQNEMVVNSDFLIPLLLLTLIKSKVLFLYSNWFYIKTFTFEQDLNSGQGGYALLTFEAVMAFVRNQKENLVSLSEKVKEFFVSVDGNNLEIFKGKIMLFNSQDDWKYVRNLDGETCMHVAAKKTLMNILLFTNEYDWNVCDYNQNTPLHSAVESSQWDPVKYLISVSNIDAKNSSLESPIHLAAKNGNMEILTLLIDKKCDLNAIDKYGNTPIFYANMSSISLFLSNGSDVNHRNNLGSTPLLFSILHGKLDMAEYLLTIPSLQVAVSDSGLRNCLHLSCFRGYLSLCKSIISLNRVNINAQTRRGNSPLHAAAEGGFIEVVKLLLSFGADPKIRNSQGRSASDLSKSDEIKSALSDYTIFLRHSHLIGDRVARVVVSSEKSAYNDVFFMVKSGQFPETSSLNTVTRSLKDFIYLRNQLMVEFPEAALSDFSDLLFSSTRKDLPHRQIRQTVKRLNFFLLELLSNSNFKNHELVWEFLVVPSIDTNLLSSRTRMKREHLLENIHDSYSPVVEGLDRTLALFQLSKESFLKLQGLLKMTGSAAKRLGHTKREMGSSLRLLRYHLIRPTSELKFDTSFNVGEVLRRLGDNLSKQSISDIIDLGDFFHDLGPSIQAVLHSLGYFERLADAFNQLLRDSSASLSALQRLESQAQSFPSDEIVVQLSEKYFQYQNISRKIQYQASYINYAESFIASETMHYREHHAKLIDSVLNDYATLNLNLEKSAMMIIEDALDLFQTENSLDNLAMDFSPTQLSFGQGSPLSRGSLLEDNPELGPIDLV